MGRRNRNREQEKKRPVNRRTLIIVLVAIAAIAVAAVLIVPNLIQPASTSIWPNPNGMVLGDANAPVKVEDFSDFQCPFCGVYARTIEPDIIKKYVETGKVQYIFVPFSFLGPESLRAAEAAYCASDQNKFWQFKEVLYNNQAGENQGAFADTRLIGFASKAGLKMNDFRPCFDSGKYKQKVQDDYTAGQTRKVPGTPYFFVNGQPVDNMKALDAAIQKAVDGSN